jgi:hypothetical protein
MDTAPPQLPAAVQGRIDSYRPTAITPARWQQCGPGIRRLVVAAPASDGEDAANLLTSAVALVAFAAPLAGTWELATIFDGPWLQRFATEWRAAGRPDNTLRNHLARLNRLRRTANGQDGSRRIRRIDREAGASSRPYGEVERRALLAATRSAEPEIAATVRLVLELADRGLVVPDAYRHGLDAGSWKAAQAWVKQHRLPGLVPLELRRMWALGVASSSNLQTALDRGVTRNELDGLRPHLVKGEPAELAIQLRSF